MNHFAQNLKRVRQEKGWSQAKAAIKLDIPKHNIGAYEEGRATPPLLVFVKIMRTLGITDLSFVDNEYKMN